MKRKRGARFIIPEAHGAASYKLMHLQFIAIKDSISLIFNLSVLTCHCVPDTITAVTVDNCIELFTDK